MVFQLAGEGLLNREQKVRVTLELGFNECERLRKHLVSIMTLRVLSQEIIRLVAALARKAQRREGPAVNREVEIVVGGLAVDQRGSDFCHKIFRTEEPCCFVGNVAFAMLLPLDSILVPVVNGRAPLVLLAQRK